MGLVKIANKLPKLNGKFFKPEEKDYIIIGNTKWTINFYKTSPTHTKNDVGYYSVGEIPSSFPTGCRIPTETDVDNLITYLNNNPDKKELFVQTYTGYYNKDVLKEYDEVFYIWFYRGSNIYGYLRITNSGTVTKVRNPSVYRIEYPIRLIEE